MIKDIGIDFTKLLIFPPEFCEIHVLKDYALIFKPFIIY